MAKFKVIKLTDMSVVHIGNGRDTYDFSSSMLHSDTLMSALSSILASRGQQDKIETFMNSVTLSSAFPFYFNHYFLPKIKGKLNVVVKGYPKEEYRKKLKKIQYIDVSIWKKLVEGQCVEIEIEQLQNCFLIDLNALNHFQESNPYKSQVNERVKIVNGEDSVPFYFDWTYYHEHAGLYVLVDCDSVLFDTVSSLFEELGQNGIGTDRSVGGGQFAVEKGEMELPIAQDASYACLLSLYIPTRHDLEQIDLEGSSYQMLKRGGYMSGSNRNVLRHLRKKSVYMFDEGSILKTHAKLDGCVVNLAPKWNDSMHPVYRSGKIFSIPINNQAYER